MTATAESVDAVPSVERVAVVAHRRKSFGPGLAELRARLERGPWAEGLLWSEVDKSRKVPSRVQEAIDAGATRLIVWGGDGTVQRAVDALRDVDPATVAVAVMPAGTANLFATNLSIPQDFDQAFAIAVGERTRLLDVGRVNGERFVVMAGTGLDAMMIRDASNSLKRRLGRASYVWTGVRNVRRAGRSMTVKVDGQVWFDGRASCALVGNVGTLIGGLTVFEHADPADGLLEVGVISAESWREWTRLLVRSLLSAPTDSPLLSCTRGRRVSITLAEKAPYELDGGDRPPVDRLRFRVAPSALRVCVP